MNDQLPPAPTTLTVASRILAADGVVSLTLRRPDGGALPAWTPGAHIDVLLNGENGDAGELIRQHSLCGDPAALDAWQIAVLREPQGRGGSAHVHDRLSEGATVRVRGPRNNFPLRPAARHLFIAGGVGITPILPMVEAAEAAGADWRLLYGGRTRTSMAFLDRLAPHGDRVHIRPQDEYGLLDLAAHLGVPKEGTLVHACGPEPLLRAVQEQCVDWPSGTLGVERFAPVPTAGSDGPGEAFEVELARSGVTLTVPAAAGAGNRGGGRYRGRLLLPGRHLRHLRDRRTRRQARPPRLAAHRGRTGCRRHHADLRLPLVRASPGPRPVTAKRRVKYW